jgi:hypothetical protein
MADLEKRLAKRQAKTEAKVKRQETKAKGRAKVAQAEGYGTVANKRSRTASDVSTARTRTVNKGPKTVSTSTSYKEGDKTTKITNKKKTTVTQSGATSGSKSGSGSSSSSGSSSRSNQGQGQGQKQQMNSQNRRDTQSSPKKPKAYTKEKRPIKRPDNVMDKTFGKETTGDYQMDRKLNRMKTGGMVNPNMSNMKTAVDNAYKSNKMRRSMPRGY